MKGKYHMNLIHMTPNRRFNALYRTIELLNPRAITAKMVVDIPVITSNYG
jgi:hypothetical protein